MVTIPWNDGSGDNLYLDTNSGSGNSVITITSDANLGNDRSIDLVLTTVDGSKNATITVRQFNHSRQFIGNDGIYLDITGAGFYER